MSLLQEHTGTLVVMRCWCGIQHAVPESLYQEQQRRFDDGLSAKGIYCPLGHSHVPGGKTKVAELERRLAREQTAHDQTKAELMETEYRRRMQMGLRTKLEKRIRAGVCPWCKRHFANLASHMQTKHPTSAKCRPKKKEN